MSVLLELGYGLDRAHSSPLLCLALPMDNAGPTLLVLDEQSPG